MTVFRGTEIYVSFQTKRRLRWIVKAVGTEQMTVDSLADQMLNEIIETRFPHIKQAEEEFEQAEQRFFAASRGEEAT